MQDLISPVEQFAELIGPNHYAQAAIIAAAFILIGKIADWVISGIAGRFRAFGDSSLNFELPGWIANPADRGRVQHDLNCAIYKALIREKIEIPFPQRDLHVRTMPATGD